MPQWAVSSWRRNNCLRQFEVSGTKRWLRPVMENRDPDTIDGLAADPGFMDRGMEARQFRAKFLHEPDLRFTRLLFGSRRRELHRVTTWMSPAARFGGWGGLVLGGNQGSRLRIAVRSERGWLRCRRHARRRFWRCRPCRETRRGARRGNGAAGPQRGRRVSFGRSVPSGRTETVLTFFGSIKAAIVLGSACCACGWSLSLRRRRRRHGNACRPARKSSRVRAEPAALAHLLARTNRRAVRHCSRRRPAAVAAFRQGRRRHDPEFRCLPRFRDVSWLARRPL